MTRFSVIIPVYNVESYLRECLDSVLCQTFQDWEAICVNDGSSDNSLAILDEYAAKDSRFKVVSQTNGGLSAARNTGMDNASGEYIVFLDSDDWIEYNTLEILETYLRPPTSYLQPLDVLCFSGRRYIEATRSFNPPDILADTAYTTGIDYYNGNALMHRDFAFVCVVLRAYRRMFLVDNGLRFKDGIYHEDNLFTPLACYYAGRVWQIPNILYNYRVRANSITDSNQSKRRKDMMGTANELASFFVTKTGFDKTIVYRAITHHYQVVLLNAPKSERKELKQLCDWRLYRAVSRTKLRHRVNYLLNHLK